MKLRYVRYAAYALVGVAAGWTSYQFARTTIARRKRLAAEVDDDDDRELPNGAPWRAVDSD